jgi:hypothetical protein
MIRYTIITLLIGLTLIVMFSTIIKQNNTIQEYKRNQKLLIMLNNKNMMLENELEEVCHLDNLDC